MRRDKVKQQVPPPARLRFTQPLYLVPLLCVALLVVVLGVFLPTLSNDFLNYDDDFYVTDNTHVRAGLTSAGVKWAFSSTELGNWHPLTWLSHMLDCQLFGLNPWGHHLSNVLIHAANTVLVFLVFKWLTSATWRSAFVAVLFGVHPLHVQSAAWVAERKDVLSAFFFLLTLAAYWRYARPSEIRTPQSEAHNSNSASTVALKYLGIEQSERASSFRQLPPSVFYLLALLCFTLGLMCKPMLVTLPLVLLLLDYWPLGRFSLKTLRALLLEKLPYFALAAVTSALTFLIQQQAGAVESVARLDLLNRCGNSLVAYCRYLSKLVYPAQLSVFYPHPGHWPIVTVLLAALFLLGITILALALRRQLPWFVIGWLWFLLTLVPVIGLVQVGAQSMADRYTYLPLLGLFIVLAWGADELARHWRVHPLLVSAASAAVVAACVTLSRQQVACWRNSGTLFQQALTVTEENSIVHLHLGNFALLEQGRLDEAISHFQAAINLEPSLADAHSQLGTALYRQGHLQAGILQLQTATRLKPSYAPAHFNLGVAFQNEGRTDDALSEFRAALQWRPDYAEAHNGLGIALETIGRIDEGISHLENAVRLKPELATAHCNLGLALVRKGRRSEAISHFTEALRLQPHYAEAERQLRALAN